VVQTVIWDQAERASGSIAKYGGSPINDLWSSIYMLPIGFLVYLLHPAGWLFWAGFALTLIARNRLFIVVSMIAAIWFGWLWPKHWAGIMGI
jgi:hypothetical protein